MHTRGKLYAFAFIYGCQIAQLHTRAMLQHSDSRNESFQGMVNVAYFNGFSGNWCD